MGQETLAAAISRHQRGELEQAEAGYLALLGADRGNVDALHFLGVLRHQQGRSFEAIDLVQKAIEIRPDYADALSNLGNIYQELGGSIEAVHAYRRALDLRPEHSEAMRNLGIALRKVQRYEEAAEVHQRAIEQRPQDMMNYYLLANAYKDMARYEDALATLRKALAIKPESEGFRRLGQLLYGMRRIDEAAANYQAWLRAEPDSPVAQHMVAACTLKDVPSRAGDAFVTRVFDGFAESFDQVLHRLEYRAPELVGNALRRTVGEPRGDLEIVDAGCGTGLLAQHLRSYARRLVGVDLSPKMLQKATRRKTYDELVVAELAAFLRASPEPYDVVASSDTLVYFGDLRAVLSAAHAALRPGGHLCFTLEHAANEEEAPAGFRIHPHGRYSHSQPYVRRTLAEAGFEVLDVETVHLRREGAVNVQGLLVVARRAGSSLEQTRSLKDEAGYLAALEAEPANVYALRGLARLRLEQGHALAALGFMRRALEARPACVDAWNTLGEIYRRLGSLAGAEDAYQRAIQYRPDHPEAARNLSLVQGELARLAAAAEAHRRAHEENPQDTEALYALAAAYQKMSRSEQALETLRQALAIKPEAYGFRRLGVLLCGSDRMEEAVANYEAWVRAEPASPLARHMLAACTGKDVPRRASDGFVTKEFDRFADTFDEVLAGLEYHAPALVAEAFRRLEREPRGELDIVDAGCGTGLLAPHLRPYARRLIGVDLSPKMIDKAARRAVYDDTVIAELTSFLRASPAAFDVVASSDTLNYFGDLREVLAAARGALRSGGRLVFTLEHAVREDEAPDGYRLHPDGRYMHTEPYVRGVLAEAGFQLFDIEKAHLRREGDAYVAGLLIGCVAGGARERDRVAHVR